MAAPAAAPRKKIKVKEVLASLGRPKFRTEFEKQVIITNLEKRGITRAKEDEDWHFFWASVGTVRSMCAFSVFSNASHEKSDGR